MDAFAYSIAERGPFVKSFSKGQLPFRPPFFFLKFPLNFFNISY